MSDRSRSPPPERPKRGIRGGAAARRKREAYLRHQEALGYDRTKVGIVHAGGLARPLYTPCTWEPESTTDEESVEFVDPEGLQQNLVDIVDLEAPAPLLPLSRPTPETVLLKARPKGPKQPSYPPPKPAGPKQPSYPPPAKVSLGVRPSSSSSATSSVPKPSAAPKVVIRPAVPKVASTPAVPKAAPKVPVPRVASPSAVPKVASTPAVPKAAPKVPVPRVASPSAVPKVASTSAVPKVASTSAVPKVASKPAVPKVDPASTAPKTPPKRAPVIDLEGPSASSSVSVRSFVPISQQFLRGVEAFSFNDRGELRQRFLETVGTLGQEGRVIAIDWHQVSDTWRLNRREAARADQDTGALPRQVIEFYNVVKQNLQSQDRLIILSHIERSERNRNFLLKSVEHCGLPVDLVVITSSRTGLGGKAAVLQALLGQRGIGRACILDDNLQVLTEVKELGGLTLHIKTQRRETWAGRSEWNISAQWPFVKVFLTSRGVPVSRFG